MQFHDTNNSPNGARRPPHLLHVVPVGDDSMLDGIFESEDSSLGLSFVPDVRILLAHAHHHALMAGATHDRREHGTGSVISRESSLA